MLEKWQLEVLESIKGWKEFCGQSIDRPKNLPASNDDPADESSSDEKRRWWWIAINGASCAASSFPLPATVRVIPTPEQLLGFRTREEQMAAQRLLLTGPVKKVRRYMSKTIPARVRGGEVAYIRPSQPEPPTHGPTQWVVAGTPGSADTAGGTT
jgi:hypothetical protein